MYGNRDFNMNRWRWKMELKNLLDTSYVQDLFCSQKRSKSTMDLFIQLSRRLSQRKAHHNLEQILTRKRRIIYWSQQSTTKQINTKGMLSFQLSLDFYFCNAMDISLQYFRDSMFASRLTFGMIKSRYQHEGRSLLKSIGQTVW